jgi:phospholipid transport system transporter-binding protein
MIERRGERLVIMAPLVMDNARELLEAGRALMVPGSVVFDLAEVTEADSSAVALMLAWVRSAGVSRSTVSFANIPEGVRSLTELYSVVDLLPRA